MKTGGSQEVRGRNRIPVTRPARESNCYPLRVLPSSRRWIFAVADVAALLIFTVIGLINHKDGITVKGVLEVMLPIVIVGAVAALLFDTYRRPGVKTLLPTWLVSVPSGILIRKALFDTPSSWGSTGIFIGVALVFTLIFLLAARLGVGFLSRASGTKHAANGDRVEV
jgi:DUF3054 family protein